MNMRVFFFIKSKMAAKMEVTMILCFALLLNVKDGALVSASETSTNVTVSTQTAPKDMCPLVTCQGHCGEHMPVTRGGCFCDDACLLHGDCCQDYMVACRGDNTTLLTSEHILTAADLVLNSTECLNIIEKDGLSFAYKVVVRCPAGASEWTRALCEDVDDPHIGQVVPVFDEDHQIIYSNMYCASCHNATSPTVLNPQFDCSGYNDILIDTFLSNGTEALNAMLVKFCRMLVPTELITIHHSRTDCRENNKVQKWCNENLNANLTAEFDVLETLCQSYQSVVFTYIDEMIVFYSNMFCAQCSGVQTEELICLESDMAPPIRPNFGVAFPSFSVMLDFTNGQTAPSVQAKFEDEPLCENSSVIDTLAAVCVADTCPHNHVPFHDGCAQLPPLLTNYTTILTITFEFSDLVGLEEFNKTFPISTVRTAIDEAFNLDLIFFEWALCPNDSLSHICVIYQGMSKSNNIPWNHLIDKSDWQTVYDPIVRLSLPLTNITMANYDMLEGPQCKNGSHIIWMEDPTVLSTNRVKDSSPDSVYVHDRKTNVSFSMASVAISLRLDKIGQRNTGLFNTKVTILWSTSMKCGHCYIPIIDCVDKVEIAPEQYTLFDKKNTGGIVVEIDGTNVSVKVGEYLFSTVGGKGDHGLVVCSGSLPQLLSWMIDLRSIHEVVQGYLTLGTLLLSIMCLMATISTHVICSELRTVPGHITMQLCVALLCAQLLFLTNKLFVAYSRACRALAVLQHVTWLTAFCWMNVFALDVCNSFLKMKVAGSERKKKRLGLYGLYSWGSPCLFALGWILAEEYQLIPIIYGGNELCWIRPGSAWILYTVGVPLGCILLINLICLLITLIIYRRMTNDSAVAVNLTKNGANKNTLAIALKLTTLMGLPWACGFLANIGPLWPLWYVFIILNASQGVFIFVTFICKRRIYTMLKSTIQQSSSQPGGSGGSQPPKQATEDACSPDPFSKGAGKMGSSRSTKSSKASSSPGGGDDFNPLREWNPQPSNGSIESGYISTRM